MHMLKREPFRVETVIPFRERMEHLGKLSGSCCGSLVIRIG